MLRDRAAQSISLDALEVVASGLAKTAPCSPRASIPATGRRFVRLLDTPQFDAWLIHWTPSSTLELHDHGGALGAVAVAAGQLTEISIDRDTRQPIRTHIASAGESFTIPATHAHEVLNAGTDEALSVHVYSPRLTKMTFFDHHPSGFLHPVYSTCGDLAALEEAAT